MEFVSNIFYSILSQIRRPNPQISKPQKLRFEEKGQDSKAEAKSPPPSVCSKLPRKPKQPKAKKQSKEETDAIYAQHLKKWQDLRQIYQPPPYAASLNQPTTVAQSVDRQGSTSEQRSPPIQRIPLAQVTARLPPTPPIRANPFARQLAHPHRPEAENQYLQGIEAK